MDDGLDYVAITRLQRAYADIASRQAWREMESIAAPEARFTYDLRTGHVIEIVGGAALADFGCQITDRFGFYQYIPLNTVVEVGAEGTASGRAYSLEVAEDRSSGDWMNFYGLYHDDYVRVAGAWYFSGRRYQTLARRAGHHLDAFPISDS